ncbi:MAG: phosphoribosylanthranilate isomerase [Alphaproteobacteria bacterium]|nr:phosphoribosylanthranilate isomerase [Alphaproteobacteria bacterium]MBU0794940.1 phosphoribosylanthranilate isomerase [Alphaproteobacteria bacterium]MBU0875915.1 phosphoribosylanthranilate isomerase [Alphaproteobacteria bacterium]MBU1770875.1 phosphoribosylanthranilate isomerase [Alphaproteobacteria bacterium]
MLRTAIKICGVKTAPAIDAAVKGGASHVGLNYFPPSPRYLALDRVALIATRVPEHVKRVGVLVDPTDDLIDTLIAAGGMQIVQLHGRETPERAAAIRQRTGLEVWKVISVKTAADLATGSSYAGAADFLLYDAKTPDGAILPGGMGLRFDWKLLADHRPPMPWGLSGGLDAENVAQAIRLTGAPLVDVSSGIESAPGVKDVDKIAAFCKAVNQC